MNETKYRDEARRVYAIEGLCEIDRDALVAKSDEGAFVQAWLWVPDNNLVGKGA